MASISEISEVVAESEIVEESEIREVVKCEIVEIEAEPEITEIEMTPVRTCIAHNVIEDIATPPYQQAIQKKFMSRVFKASVIVFLITIFISTYIVIGCVHITDNQPVLGFIDINDVNLELDISNHTLLVGENATLDVQFSKPTKMVGYPDLRVYLDLGYNLLDGLNGSQSFTLSSKDDHVFPIVNDSVILRFNRLEIELENRQLSALKGRFDDVGSGGMYWMEITGDFEVEVTMKIFRFLRLHKHISFSCKMYFTGKPPVLVMAGKHCVMH